MYTVYKITNLVNEKFYIGVHKTDNPNDKYMGSGIAVRRAIKKYGRENFVKDILFVTECKEEAYKTEASFTEDYNREDSYNLKQGGVGGFTRENALKGNAASLKLLTKEQLSANGKKGYLKSNNNPVECGRKGGLANKGKSKSEAHKQKLREAWIRKKLERTGSQAVKATTS